MLAGKDLKKFQEFLRHRNSIHGEIDGFLYVVFRHLIDLENKKFNEEQIAKGISNKFPSLIKSLCQIHGLYGYPATTKSEYSLGDKDIKFNINAVREIFNKMKEDGKTLGDYHERAKKDEFWNELDMCNITLNDFVREPAHILVEMMKDLFKGERDACEIMGILEHLGDGNFLKPAVWAEYKKTPNKNCGFSLGVRRFVRPLYLYTKLRELREDGDNGVNLEDVEAYECAARNLFRKNPSLTKKKSKYKIEDEERRIERQVKPPCKSCVIFFRDPREVGRDKKIGIPFGNCGEFDVIKTCKLDKVLGNEKLWRSFTSSCEQHLQVFNTTSFIADANERRPYDIMVDYYNNTLSVKCLKYKWERASYKLALEWPD